MVIFFLTLARGDNVAGAGSESERRGFLSFSDSVNIGVEDYRSGRLAAGMRISPNG